MERKRPKVKWYHYILPNSWPYWVVISVFWLFSLLPYRLLKGLGWCLGSILFFIPCYSRTIAKINLELCFPELDAKARRRLFLKCYQSVGFCFFETALALFASNRRVAPWVSFKNVEVLEQAEKEGVGVIVFGCLALASL